MQSALMLPMQFMVSIKTAWFGIHPLNSRIFAIALKEMIRLASEETQYQLLRKYLANV